MTASKRGLDAGGWDAAQLLWDGAQAPSEGGIAPDQRFSFFVTSLAAMQQLSGNQLGFGGDLRFGMVGEGAGLLGADAICASIARTSLGAAESKQWRAFLSSSTVDARDRIGTGPWYDRAGRLVAADLDALLATRPRGEASIANDLPNEHGIPNHDPDGSGPVDNHDVLTGSDERGGRLQGVASNCADWTSTTVAGAPRVGHSWVRQTTGSLDSFSSAHEAAGCAAGVSLIERGRLPSTPGHVGSGGGYGAIYCFALTP